MIEFTRSYKTEDGQVFGTIEEAQIHELTTLLGKGTGAESVAKQLLDQKAKFIDILTMTPNSKPRARSLHGGTKKRTKKTVITDAATSVTTSQNDPTTDAQ